MSIVSLKNIKLGLLKPSTWQDQYYDGNLTYAQIYDEHTREIIDLIDLWDHITYLEENENDEYTLKLMSGKITRII